MTERPPLDAEALALFYRGYIDCLNRQAWGELGDFVHEEVERNGRRLGLSGYRGMLVRDYATIPDLRFEIALLVCEPPMVAARLDFSCHPRAGFLGLDAGGRRVSFSENVFYAVRDCRIASVWSILDKAAIEAQLSAGG